MGDTAPGESRIGAEYYTDAYFSGEAAAHLVDENSRFQRYRVRKVLQMHEPGPDDSVVDLGCGWGTFGLALAGRVGSVTGVDFSERAVELCRARAEERGAQNLTFVCADAGATGLEADSFDVALAADLFEHLYPDDSERVAAEAFRILKPGGAFVTWTPHRGHVLEALKNRNILLSPDPSHVDYKSMAAMKALLEGAGFTIGRAYYAESHLPVFNVLERLTQPFLPFMRRRVAVLGVKPVG